jgi:hypothetical protein
MSGLNDGEFTELLRKVHKDFTEIGGLDVPSFSAD